MFGTWHHSPTAASQCGQVTSSAATRTFAARSRSSGGQSWRGGVSSARVRSRWLVAQANTQRRHVGEAVAALLEADKHAPEVVQGHPRSRETIHELIQLSGRRAPAELTDLAERAAALP